jgi:glycosyltransferase involved in cell wall biosynthesis
VQTDVLPCNSITPTLDPMRVAICQPLIPAYRLPLFERLGALPTVELTVYAGGSSGSLEGFQAGTSFRVVSAPVYRWVAGLGAQFAQVTALWRGGFDLMIAPWDIHYLTLAPAVALARSSGVPIVLWGHGYSQRPHRLTDAARNICGRLADGVLLYSQSVAAALISEYRFSVDRVFVAPNALDQSPIQAARQSWLGRPPALAEFQRLHGIDPAQTIVFISRLEASNRTELLLQATEALSREHPRLKTVIVGNGSQRERLGQLARSLGIHDRVIFTGAIYDEPTLAPWMLSGSLFCYPTNVGLSILHAFGYGLPSVTSDNIRAHNPEIEALIPDVNGLRYREGDLHDLVRQCARILDDPALQSRLSEAASKTALEQYSMDQMVEGFKQVFHWAGGHRDRRAGVGKAL